MYRTLHRSLPCLATGTYSKTAAEMCLQGWTSDWGLRLPGGAPTPSTPDESSTPLPKIPSKRLQESFTLLYAYNRPFLLVGVRCEGSHSPDWELVNPNCIGQRERCLMPWHVWSHIDHNSGRQEFANRLDRCKKNEIFL